MRTYKRKVDKRRKNYCYIGQGNKYDYTIFQIWEMIIGIIEKDLDKISFYTWFRSAKPLTLVNNRVLNVLVDNIVIKETLDRNYMRVIKDAARRAGFNTLKFAIVAKER